MPRIGLALFVGTILSMSASIGLAAGRTVGKSSSMQAQGVSTMIEMMVYVGNRIEGLAGNKPWQTTRGRILNLRYGLGRIKKAIALSADGDQRLVITRRGIGLAERRTSGKGWRLLPFNASQVERAGKAVTDLDKSALDVLQMPAAQLQGRTLQITKQPLLFVGVPLKR